jgi:hypothetical protein
MRKKKSLSTKGLLATVSAVFKQLESVATGSKRLKGSEDLTFYFETADACS